LPHKPSFNEKAFLFIENRMFIVNKLNSLLLSNTIMKKNITYNNLCLLITLFFCTANNDFFNKKCILKQAFNNTQIDTVRYLKEEIYAQKDKYIGKTLQHLLSDMKLKPVSFFVNIPSKNRYYFDGIQLVFCSFNKPCYSSSGHAEYIGIIWDKPILNDTINALSRKYKSDWNAEVESKLKNMIIKDLYIRKY